MSDADGSPTDASDTGQDRADRSPSTWQIGLLVALGVAVLVGGIAYLWPTVGRSSGRLDVVVAGDGFALESQQALERRLRERGLSVESLVAASSSLCDDRAALEGVVRRRHPRVVVLSFQHPEPDCPGIASTGDPTAALYGDVVRSLGDARVVLAVQPAAQDEAVQSVYLALRSQRRASVADPSTLLGGAAAPAAMRCQWWDDCRPDGTVEVRAGDGGALTDAGGQRFARVVVGVIP
jgi:hypothetical protein